jgi:cytochrome c peroxidase
MCHFSGAFIAFFACFSVSVLAVEGTPVRLGSDSLTKGIPGTGALKWVEIEAWLAKSENHKTLEIELPPALQIGVSQVYIPADNPLTLAKIELGRQLYFDKRFSKNAELSCADCHHPNFGYAKNTQFGVGVAGQTGNRNSPVAYNRILSKEQFWDGRAGSLEAQAVGPIANPIEMQFTHELAVKLVSDNKVYRKQFEKIFGRAPNIDDVGRALASFERVLVTGDSVYDANEPFIKFQETFKDDLEDLDALKEDDPALFAKYTKLKATVDANPMSESAIRGRALFFSAKANCAACHVGANFTDEKYHNLGVGMDAKKPDLGRETTTGNAADRGAFKTPTLRNISQTAPYMHDGSQKTLEEVVDWYVKGGHPNPNLSDKIKKFDATAQDKSDLVEFMKALTGSLPKVEMGRLPE